MNTADGSPNRRAMVSSSWVGLRTAPSTWSTRTRISLMLVVSSVCDQSWGRPRSDELLRGKEPDQRLGAAAALVCHDLAGGARRTGLGALDPGPRLLEADLAGVDPDVGELQGLQWLLLRGHVPLERRVARLTVLVGHRQHQRRGRADHL